MKILTIIFAILIMLPSHASDKPTKENCKTSDSGEFKADCIELGIYDPCDDATGSYGTTVCVVAHRIVQERRIQKAIVAITEKKTNLGFEKEVDKTKYRKTPIMDYLLRANIQWKEYIKQQCLFSNKLYQNNIYIDGSYGQCELNLTKQRADYLWSIVPRLKYEY